MIQPVHMPLQSFPTLEQIDTPALFGVICKPTEGALKPLTQIIDKDWSFLELQSAQPLADEGQELSKDLFIGIWMQIKELRSGESWAAPFFLCLGSDNPAGG